LSRARIRLCHDPALARSVFAMSVAVSDRDVASAKRAYSSWLSIVRELARAIGAELEMYCREGKGG